MARAPSSGLGEEGDNRLGEACSRGRGVPARLSIEISEGRKKSDGRGWPACRKVTGSLAGDRGRQGWGGVGGEKSEDECGRTARNNTPSEALIFH